MSVKSGQVSFHPSSAAAALSEEVAWLNCRGRTPASLYEEIHRVLLERLGNKGVLFLMPLHLEHVEGPLTDFVLGLESILQTPPMPVVLGDPSGYATLVLSTLHRESEIRIYRPTGASARPRRALVVDASGPSSETVVSVLDAFGHQCDLARSAPEARRALKASDYDFVLLDLDLPRVQSFGIADSLRERRRVATVAVTASEELWVRENLRRYEFRRILSRPLSIVELLEELA